MRPSNIRPALIFFYASTWQTAAVTTSPSPCGATEKDAQKLHMHLPLFMCAGFYAPRYFQHQPYLHLSAYGKTSSSRRKPGIMVFRVCFLLRICGANIVIKSWYVLHKFRKIISAHRCIFPAALNVFLTQQLRSNGCRHLRKIFIILYECDFHT